MKKVYFLLCAMLSAFLTYAQLLTWTPAFAKDNDNITITVDATKGNQGLMGFSGNVYVHIGLITSASINEDDWKYAPFTWATTPANGLATPAGTNKWSYTINNIRSFFNVTNSAETIKAIAILFRDAAGNLVQRNANVTVFNGNMYVRVYDNNLAIRFSVPPYQPYYIPIPEAINKQVGDNISVTAIASQAADMKLYLNGTVIQTASNTTSISANPALTVSGNTEIVAEATAAAVTKKDTLRFFVTPGVTVAPLPAGVKNGINYAANNTEATLVLYAPGKNRVSLIGEFAGSNWTEQSQYLMNKTPDGNYWWLTVTGLTSGNEYAFQYLVDGVLKIADPYTEKILSPEDNGIDAATYPGLKAYPGSSTTGNVSVLQTAAPAYNWQNVSFTRPDKKNLIIYEMLMRDFTDAHRWQVMIDTLTYLQRLGINAVELMPVSEFEGNDSWGYNPSFSFAPDKYYGTKNKLKEFIDSCHSRQIAVIMDVVPNHCYNQSPLAQLYWNAAQNRPAADNPWLNVVQPHAFGFGNDFNHESAATKYFWRRMFDFWLREYKMDGYRMDFTKGLTQKPSSDDGQFSAYDQSRVDILKDYADTIWKYFPSSYIILEHLAASAEEQALQNLGFLLWGGKRENVAYNEATMGYHDNNKSNISSIVYSSSERGFTNPHLVGYMESHDEERLMYKNITYGNIAGSYSVKNDSIALRRMEAAASLFFTIPGPKMIWQFGERGYDKSIFACADNSIPQPYGTNESCKLTRKEPRWQYMQEIKRKRLYDVYAALIKLRNTQPALFNSTNFNYNLVNAVKYFSIIEASLSALVVANFDVVPANTSVTFSGNGIWYDYLSGETITATGAAQAITLQPGEYHVYLSKNITNVVTTPVIDINNPGNALQLFVYPNPLAGNSVAELFIPEKGNVQMDLWNIQGQKVTGIFSGTLTRGKHTIVLSSKTNNLPAGMYLLQVQAKNKTQSVKILIQ